MGFGSIFKAIGRFIVAAFTGFEVAEFFKSPDKSMEEIEKELAKLKSELKTMPDFEDFKMWLIGIFIVLTVLFLMLVGAKAFAVIRKSGKKSGQRS